MARYIDADVLIEMLNNKAKTDFEMGLYNHGSLTQSFIKFVERQPTADVVPKSEADEWYHEYHAIKEALKQEKMYHRATEKLADRYCAELQTAKKEGAREIFEEIEKALEKNKFQGLSCLLNEFAELKKKYM